MLVKDGMSSPVITVKTDSPLADAAAALTAHRIHQLPVVNENGRLAGIITDRDLRAARAQPGFETRPVASVMTAKTVTIHPEDTLEDALLLLQQHRFGALPVVDDDDRPVGIFTRHDGLNVLVEVLGLSEPGGRLDILIEDPVTDLAKAVQVLAQHNASLISAVLPRQKQAAGRRLYVRVRTINPSVIEDALTRVGLRIVAPGRFEI